MLYWRIKRNPGKGNKTKMPLKLQVTKVHQMPEFKSIGWTLVFWGFGGRKRLFRNNYLK